MKSIIRTIMVGLVFISVLSACNGEEDTLTLEQRDLLQQGAEATDPSDNDKGGLKGDDD